MSKVAHPARLIARQSLNQSTLLLRFECPELVQEARPGQFVEVEVPQFLKRPFGLAGWDHEAGTFDLGVRILGAGTRAFLDLPIGSVVTVLGPLGHGFQIDEAREALLLGGGTGLFPLFALAQVLRERGLPYHFWSGFRNQKEMFLDLSIPEMKRATVATDQGDFGFHGTVLDALKADEGTFSNRPCKVYACGPIPMLKALYAYARSQGWPGDYSLEARMGCGLGLCLTCAIPVRTEQLSLIREADQTCLTTSFDPDSPYTYLRCCYEGPVFDGDLLDWDRL